MLRAVRVGIAMASLWLLAGCTLLIDTDSLTKGRSSQGGSDSDGGSAGAANGGGSCVPNQDSASCDGLDLECQPTLSEPECPSGCTGTTQGSIAYMACKTSAPFNAAEVMCQAQGMDLVQIDSASENTFVTQLAGSLGSYIWLGGSDLAENGTFAWPSGTAFFQAGAAVSGVYQHFAVGEPALDPARHCVQLHDDPPGYWYVTSCTESKQFICKR
jgi:hypothetical protein